MNIDLFLSSFWVVIDPSNQKGLLPASVPLQVTSGNPKGLVQFCVLGDPVKIRPCCPPVWIQ